LFIKIAVVGIRCFNVTQKKVMLATTTGAVKSLTSGGAGTSEFALLIFRNDTKINFLLLMFDNKGLIKCIFKGK
jgi:hypothetical protein